MSLLSGHVVIVIIVIDPSSDLGGQGSPPALSRLGRAQGLQVGGVGAVQLERGRAETQGSGALGSSLATGSECSTANQRRAQEQGRSRVSC